jgi:3-hydroxybutyryl-CoA dehydrogenase
MKLNQVQTIGMLGGGVMGSGIAQILAVGGYDVIVRDISDELVDATRDACFESRWGIKRAVEIGKLEFDVAVDAMTRISFTTEVADFADVDFVIEAVPEKLELKQEVFAELDGIVKPEAIFTTNTSGFVIGEVARDVSDQRKTLFAGMHFASPVPAMKMCEVIYTPETSEDTIEAVKGVAERAGKAVSMVKDMPETYGFILNRVFAAARREAQQLIDDGIANEEDIDKAMVTGRNWPAAFFGKYGPRGGIGKQWD